MSDEKSITRHSTAITPRSVDDVARLAKMAHESGLAKVTSPAAAGVIILTGAELGLSPMQSLRGIYVIDGKPVLSADLMVAIVRRSEVCAWWRTVESTPDVCTIATQRVGESAPSEKTWRRADAERAGVTGKQPWRQYPAQMLRHRCAADLAREVYPDVMLGLYTPDEMEPASEIVEPPPQRADVRPVDPRDLAPLGVEAPIAAAPAPVAFASPGLSDAEMAAMLAILTSASTVEALDTARAEMRPDVSTRATREQRATLRDVAETRRAALAPPPDSDPPKRRRGPVRATESTATADAPAESPASTDGPAAWAGDLDAMRSHVAGYAHPRAVEHGARKHGVALGAQYLALCVDRLDALTPADHDGARVSLVTLRATVERWAREGVRVTRSDVQRAA